MPETAPPAPSLVLVLASTSPYRRELLKRLQLPFTTVAPEIDETPLDGEHPADLVRRLARAKASACGNAAHPALVIGSDQVAFCGGEILGKPGSHANAAAQLQFLSGRRVEFFTGICLYNTGTGEAQLDVVPFAVTFRELPADTIEHYLQRDKPYNCAGSFRSESLGICLFEAMHGDDPTALMGLPLIRLTTMLQAEGVPLP